MLDRTEFAQLIPHAGQMCLLDAVVAWDGQGIHALSERYAAASNPLRAAGGLHAVHLAEYGAQAMAVHGALVARARGESAVRQGRLVSLREVVLAVDCVDAAGGRLEVHAQQLFADDAGAQYAFQVEQAGRVLASGRAAVIYVA
jgi:predicted hotdog family 3-hydroxylacyl-ACP dehydratase